MRRGSRLVVAAGVVIVLTVVACHTAPAPAPVLPASASRLWLDTPDPAPWNQPGAAIPPAPTVDGNPDPRCRAGARPAERDEDRRVRAAGWDLVGPYQAGWEMVVIQATAAYDGMCRPWAYQAFVFVRGAFAGTLSPEPMGSRTDGALSRVFLQEGPRLAAEYWRYAPDDPLCCPSRTTVVTFEVAPLVRPVSAFTTAISP